jgi:predicted RNA-binding protein
MSEDHKHNILFFQNPTMKGLYEVMEIWQNDNQKRFLSMNIQKDGAIFYCIALTNPSEVIIVGGNGGNYAQVSNGNLNIKEYK